MKNKLLAMPINSWVSLAFLLPAMLGEGGRLLTYLFFALTLPLLVFSVPLPYPLGNFSSLSPGNYFISIQTKDNRRITRPFIKK